MLSLTARGRVSRLAAKHLLPCVLFSSCPSAVFDPDPSLLNATKAPLDFDNSASVYREFITEAQEQTLIEELQAKLKRYAHGAAVALFTDRITSYRFNVFFLKIPVSKRTLGCGNCRLPRNWSHRRSFDTQRRIPRRIGTRSGPNSGSPLNAQTPKRGARIAVVALSLYWSEERGRVECARWFSPIFGRHSCRFVAHVQ